MKMYMPSRFQVAIREDVSAMLKVQLPPLESALITPVADPQTGSTVALLVCANAKAGRFAVHDELFAEGAAYHLGLLWQHHIQLLRLVPLPGAPLAPPDEAAALLHSCVTSIPAVLPSRAWRSGPSSTRST